MRHQRTLADWLWWGFAALIILANAWLVFSGLAT